MHSPTHQCFLQLQTEEDCVSYLLEALEDVCLQVPVGDHRSQLCLVEPQHALAAILVERQLTLGRHARHQGHHVRLEGVSDLRWRERWGGGGGLVLKLTQSNRLRHEIGCSLTWASVMFNICSRIMAMPW